MIRWDIRRAHGGKKDMWRCDELRDETTSQDNIMNE